MLTTTLSRKGGVRLAVVLIAAIMAAVTALVGRPVSADVIPDYYNVKDVMVEGNVSQDVNTGISLKTGDRVVVTGKGKINPGCLFCNDTGPEGYKEPAPDDGWPLKGARQYSLLGKINGQYFYIGAGKDWVHHGGPGELYLYVNDWKTDDNKFAFFADIRVDRDVPLPETTITSGPSGIVNTDSAFFTYQGSSPEGEVKYQCSLDHRGFSDCPSGGQSYGGLSDGQHTFEVRAVDRFNQVDTTPASRTWEVDTTPPDTNPPTIGSVKPAPGSNTRDRTPLISAVVRDAQTNLTQGKIKLTVDGRAKGFAYDAVRDKLVYQSKKLAYGKHMVRITATDAAGNTGSKTWSFKVVR
jgi:hypothetical protein